MFREDQDVPERFRAHLLDYFKSGYGESLVLLLLLKRGNKGGDARRRL